MQVVRVVVKPGSKKGPYIQPSLDGSLTVCVREPAIEGKANVAVIKELAKYYDIPKTRINLKKGSTGKYKTFIIE